MAFSFSGFAKPSCEGLANEQLPLGTSVIALLLGKEAWESIWATGGCKGLLSTMDLYHAKSNRSRSLNRMSTKHPATFSTLSVNSQGDDISIGIKVHNAFEYSLRIHIRRRILQRLVA